MEDTEFSFEQSLSVVKASELFPGKRSFDKDAPDLQLPFEPLYGEFPEYLGSSEEGVVAVSNLRLFIKTSCSSINIPLGLIDSVEVREIFYLLILCKDARTIRLTFSTNELCQLWHRRLFHLTALPKKKEDIYAYWLRAYCSDCGEEARKLHAILSTPHHTYMPDPDCENRDGVPRHYPSPTPSVHFSSYKELLEYEIKRMGFDMAGPWKISNVNVDYSMCSTYPQYLLIPGSISNELLRKVAGYRSYGRVPNVVWRHSGNGAVIARCSQPQVGILGWRCNEDEDLIKALGDACAYDPGPHPTPMPRSRHSSAFAACPEEYPDLTMDSDEIQLAAALLAPQLRPTNGTTNEDSEEDEESDVHSKVKNHRRLTFSSSSESEVSNSIPVPFAEACDSHSSPSSLKDLTGESRNRQVPRVLIVDARSFSAAVANRGRGGGYECPEYYPNCDIQYMNLANIHTIRKSFQALRHLCYSSSQDPVSWLSWLETSKWMTHLSALLKSAVAIVRTVASEGRPVVIHCSDGWDRTPQLVALAELIMDPFYRRMDGFQVLIEREWLAFGHKFGDRCGQGCGPGSNAHDQNERCPVFSQWLDCVYQLMHQFPTAFQFNSNYLITVLQHVYSNVFGTFLFNSAQERQQNSVAEQTYSLWSYLQPAHGSRFVNPLYCPSEHQTLFPSWNVRDFVVWPVYLPGRDNPPPPSFPLSASASAPSLPNSARSRDAPKPVPASLALNNDPPKSESSDDADGDGELDGVEATADTDADADAETVVEDRDALHPPRLANQLSNFSVNSAATDDYSDLADEVDEEVAVEERSRGATSPAVADEASETPSGSMARLEDEDAVGVERPSWTNLVRTTGQCPLCYPQEYGVADDRVLDRIDFVHRARTDPEHQREVRCRALVEQIAALKFDLRRTRLELNKCRNVRTVEYGIMSDAKQGLEKGDKKEAGFKSKTDKQALEAGDRSSNSSWQFVSDDNGVADFDSNYDADDGDCDGGGRTPPTVDPRRVEQILSNGTAVLAPSPGFCRASSGSASKSGSGSGSFRSRRPASANKGAKMVQPVHT